MLASISDCQRFRHAKLVPLDEDEDGGMRGKVVEVATNTNFDLFIAFFIVTNVVTMAFESFKQVLLPQHPLSVPTSSPTVLLNLYHSAYPESESFTMFHLLIVPPNSAG